MNRFPLKSTSSAARRPRKSSRTTRSRRSSSKTRGVLPRFSKQAHVLAIRLAWIAAIGLVCYLVYIYGVAPYTSRWQALYG